MNTPQYITQLTKDWFRSVSKKRVQGTCIRIDEAEDSYAIGVDLEALEKLLDIDPQSADLSNVENGKIVVGESYAEGGVSKKRLTCVSDFAKDVDALLIRTTGTKHNVEVDAKKVKFKSELGSPVSGDFVCLDSNLNLVAVRPETKLSGYATKGHIHSEYAASNHSHSEYAASNHTHSDYAASNHTHSDYATTDSVNQLADATANLTEVVSGIVGQIESLDIEVLKEEIDEYADAKQASVEAEIESAGKEILDNLDKYLTEDDIADCATFTAPAATQIANIDVNGNITGSSMTYGDFFSVGQDGAVTKKFVDTTSSQTIRGNKTFNSVTKFNSWIGSGVENGSWLICGGNGWQDGSHVVLTKNGSSSDGGAAFSIVSSGGANRKYYLTGKSEGTLTWGGKTTDTTATDSTELPTLGYINGKFIRKSQIGVANGVASYGHTHEGYGTVKKVLGASPDSSGNVTGILGTGSNQAAKGDHTHSHISITDFDDSVRSLISSQYPTKSDFGKDEHGRFNVETSVALHSHDAADIIISTSGMSDVRLSSLFTGEIGSTDRIDARNIKIASGGGIVADETSGALKLKGERTQGKFVAVDSEGSLVTPEEQPCIEDGSAEGGDIMAMSEDGSLTPSGLTYEMLFDEDGNAKFVTKGDASSTTPMGWTWNSTSSHQDTWSAGGTANVSFKVVTRVIFNQTTKSLCEFCRTLSYDNSGLLLSVGKEEMTSFETTNAIEWS